LQLISSFHVGSKQQYTLIRYHIKFKLIRINSVFFSILTNKFIYIIKIEFFIVLIRRKLVSVQNLCHGIHRRFVILQMHGLKKTTNKLCAFLSRRMDNPLLVLVWLQRYSNLRSLPLFSFSITEITNLSCSMSYQKLLNHLLLLLEQGILYYIS
jgi:hypothetical protein